MKDKTTRKQQTDILFPGEDGWELWTGDESGAFTLQQSFSLEAGSFPNGHARRVLAMPAARVWVLPAWFLGTGDAQLRSMAGLYLERVGVRTTSTGSMLEVTTLTQKDGASLVRLVASKDHGPSLTQFNRLPDRTILAPALLNPPPDSILIWRELGRLAMAVTQGPNLVYYSPLSAATLDENAITEVLNACVQLVFQKVIFGMSGIVLWMGEGDTNSISRFTGLQVRRLVRPAPRIPAQFVNTVSPADIESERTRQEISRKKRLVGLSLAAAAALAVASIAGLAFWASRARTAWLDEIATLTPKASRVEQQKHEWEEVAVAVDSSRSPMEILLHAMEPPSSSEVSLTHFEVTPERIVLRGRTATPAQALQYAQEMRSLPSLTFCNFDAAPPAIASDNSPSFELKGGSKP
ncbi:MAG: hypothetical protein WCN98_00295 [Verrucomicrobiaceae bacterium]